MKKFILPCSAFLMVAVIVITVSVKAKADTSALLKANLEALSNNENTDGKGTLATHTETTTIEFYVTDEIYETKTTTETWPCCKSGGAKECLDVAC